MNEESHSFPERPHTHVVGEAALSAFKYKRPQEWNITESKTDYGWDIYVEIPEAGRMKGLAFSVQLKGTDNPKFIDGSAQVSFQLQVSTVNFLLAKLEPPMVAVCHTTDPDEPVYWVWLREAIDAVQSSNPLWQKQETVSIHLPTSSKLARLDASTIADYVRKRYDVIKIGQKVYEVLGLGVKFYESSEVNSYLGEPERYVKEQVLPNLSAAGLVETFDTPEGESTEPLSPDDQMRYRTLKEVGKLLEKIRDKEAGKLLDEIGSTIDSASDGIKARYLNSRGVLALHLLQDSEALSCFEKALALRPHNHKYISNRLFLQFHIHQRSSAEKPSPMQTDWVTHLEKLVQEHPDFSPAIRLKAYWISETEGPEAAETFLSSSAAWNNDKEATRECAAEIYKNAGNNHKALSLLEEAELSVTSVSPTSSSLKAFILMRLALNDTSSAEELELRGYGPKELDLDYLHRSFEVYADAITAFREAGFPLLSESPLVNFSAVAGLLEQPSACEEACRQFLKYHPDSTEVSAALASSLVYQRRALEAVSILKRLHQSNPSSLRFFKNLILCQLVAEEYEDLLLIVRNREKSGFQSIEEEGLARSMAAVSLAELGEQAKARDQIEALRKKPELIANATVAEADVVWRTTRNLIQVSQIYQRGLAESPEDPFLQTMFALQVGTASHQSAKLTVPVLESIEATRQLAPEEYLLLVRGLLVLDQPERAASVLGRAVTRYPRDSRFIFEHSSVQLMLGNEEAAYHSIQEYLKREKSYHALRECAVLARKTGRLNEAIKSFELASHKATIPDELGGIHCQLYLLKKLRGDASKDILRHAYEFGKTTSKDPEKEAQYFIMFLTAPSGVDINDQEIKMWCEELQTRIHEFSVLHPQYHSFRAFKIDNTKPAGEQFKNAITDIIAKTLPRELATTPMRMAARSQNWPLVLRATYYPDIRSVFELWDKCTKSKEFEYGIHIWANGNDLVSELAALERSREVCIDINGLLSLAELELLEVFSSIFDLIYLAKGTKQLLAFEQVSLSGPHPLSEKIEKWRINNIAKIRTRAAEPSKGKTTKTPNSDTSVLLEGKEDDFSIDKLLGQGVGESLLLSRRLGISLYSDESSVRIWAASDYGVESFSTLALLRHLQQSSRINELVSIKFQAEMIQRNFRVIPFGARHLIEPLKDLIQQKGKNFTYTDLREHPILNVYLKEFAESVITIDSLARVAVDWWFAIVFDRNIPIDCLSVCLEGPSRALILWRTFSGVLEKVEDEPEKRAAALWAGFLWRCYWRDEEQVENVWRSIKDCCSNIFPGQYEKQRAVLFHHLPRFLAHIVSKERGISSDKKLTLYVSLPWKLPPPDRTELEEQFLKHSHNLSR